MDIRAKAGVAGSEPAQGFAKQQPHKRDEVLNNETAALSRAACDYNFKSQ